MLETVKPVAEWCAGAIKLIGVFIAVSVRIDHQCIADRDGTLNDLPLGPTRFD